MGQDRLAQGLRGEDHDGVTKSGDGSGEGEGILVLDGDEVVPLQVRGQGGLRVVFGIEVGPGQTQSQGPTRKGSEQSALAAGGIGRKPGEGSGVSMNGHRPRNAGQAEGQHPDGGSFRFL